MNFLNILIFPNRIVPNFMFFVFQFSTIRSLIGSQLQFISQEKKKSQLENKVLTSINYRFNLMPHSNCCYYIYHEKILLIGLQVKIKIYPIFQSLQNYQTNSKKVNIILKNVTLSTLFKISRSVKTVRCTKLYTIISIRYRNEVLSIQIKMCTNSLLNLNL